MPIETSVEGDLVTFRVTGLPKAPQIMQAITNHFSRTPTKLALWDLRDAILADIDAAEFEMLMENADRYAGVRGPGARAAIVTRDGADALLARAFEAHAQGRGSSINTRFFADLASAQAWLWSSG
jgi:hypothetical protein